MLRLALKQYLLTTELAVMYLAKCNPFIVLLMFHSVMASCHHHSMSWYCLTFSPLPFNKVLVKDKDKSPYIYIYMYIYIRLFNQESSFSFSSTSAYPSTSPTKAERKKDIWRKFTKSWGLCWYRDISLPTVIIIQGLLVYIWGLFCG
jgi:hypothetical protein